MEYIVRRTLDPDKMEQGEIREYPWGGSYRPRTTFRAGHDGRVLRVLMRCEELDPLARVTERNGRVWCDSCMEFFIAPGADAFQGYFNFEMNANGALLLHFGHSGTEHVTVDWPMPSELALEAERGADAWTLSLTVPFALFQKYLPEFAYAPGLRAHGNFYKCGDETAEAHFGCFFPIDPKKVPEPSFHQPAYYGPILFE